MRTVVTSTKFVDKFSHENNAITILSVQYKLTKTCCDIFSWHTNKEKKTKETSIRPSNNHDISDFFFFFFKILLLVPIPDHFYLWPQYYNINDFLLLFTTWKFSIVSASWSIWVMEKKKAIWNKLVRINSPNAENLNCFKLIFFFLMTVG